MAMRSRLCGSINDALRQEAKCQAIYDKLPAWAKW